MISLCEVLACIGIKGNEEAHKAAKQAIDIPGMTMPRLPHTDFFLTIKTLSDKGNGKTIISKLHHIKPHIKEWESAHNSCRQYKVKLSKIRIRHTRLTHRHLMPRNIQQPTCGNAAYQNKRLKIKHCLQDRPPMEGQQKKTHYPG